MGANKWVYRLSDSVFVRGGFYEPDYDRQTEAVAELSSESHPNQETERYDGTSQTERRAATPEELATAAAQRVEAAAVVQVDTHKAIKATILTALWGRLGRQPTSQEIANERSRFIAIYKAL